MFISPPSTKSWHYVKKSIIAELFFDPIDLAPPYLVGQNGREGGGQINGIPLIEAPWDRGHNRSLHHYQPEAIVDQYALSIIIIML